MAGAVLETAKRVASILLKHCWMVLHGRDDTDSDFGRADALWNALRIVWDMLNDFDADNTRLAKDGVEMY